MRRGTTAPQKLTLPISTDLIDVLEVTYKQGEKIILQKHKDDCELDGNTIKYTLTQEETFLFSHEKYATVQVRMKTNDGDVLGTEIEKVDVKESQSEEVL